MKASSPDDPAATAAISLLGRLVGFDTVSANSNLPLIDFVAEYLDSHGVASVQVASDDGRKAGLIASIGRPVEGGVVLSGHTDVVPVEGQAWSSDPFTLTRRGERLHGRGTADMKGFIAAVLALVPWFRAQPLQRPIHFAFSYDEEVGCLGAPRLIEALLARVPAPAFAIIGEPTGMQVAERHRGINSFVTTVSGRGGHSSAPERGVNAIVLAARLALELERLAAAPAADHEDGGDGELEPVTVNVGRIEGGAAVNMIAEHCRLVWECRSASDRAAPQLAARLERFAADLVAPARLRAPEVAVATQEQVAVPAFVAGPAVKAVALQLSGHDHCIELPFTSEAGLFQRAGIPAVVCGPGRLSEAHQPDEFVACDELAACLRFLRRLGAWAS